MNAHELVGKVREALRDMTSVEKHTAHKLLRELTENPDVASRLRLLNRDIADAKEAIGRAEDIIESLTEARR